MAGSPRVQLSLKGRLLSEVAFVGPQLRIGRMRENDVVVNNLAVSRFHAVLRREGEGYVLEDLGSENGTQLNGGRISGIVPLAPGDVIQLGKYELRLELGPGIALAGAPKQRSDAWDSSQTFLALSAPPAKPAPAPEPPVRVEKPVIAPSPLAARPAAPAPLEMAAEEELALPVLDAIELAGEAAEPSPDPDGAFAFDEGDVAEDAELGASASDVALTDPLSSPRSPEHTSLFDFGAPAPPAAMPAAGEEIPADFSDAEPAAMDPAPAAAGKLYAGVIVQRDGKLHLLRTWEDGELCAGRAPECEIVLADAGVSRRHAVFTRSGDRYSVRDLQSVNGIYVNGQRTKEHELAVGDVVRIESFELTFVLDHSPIASEVSAPTALPGKAQDSGRATQFSLEGPAREGDEALELAPLAADPSAPNAPSAGIEDPGDAFEILPPADDPMAGEVQTAEPVLALDLPESDLVSAEGFDEGDEEKQAESERAVAAPAPHTAGLSLRLALDGASLSPRAREALATLAEEGVALSARFSFERE